MAVLSFKKDKSQIRKDVYQILGVTNSREALRAIKRMEMAEALEKKSDMKVYPDGVGKYGHRPGHYMDVM